MRSSRYILPIFLLLLCFFAIPHLCDPNAVAKGYLFYGFTLGGLICWVVTQRQVRIDRPVVPLVVLAGVLMVSDLHARNPEMGLTFIAALITSIGIFVIARQIILSVNPSAYWVMGSIAATALLFAVLGLGQFLARVQLGYQPGGMYIPYLLPKIYNLRIAGPFGQPNFHALLMVVGLCGFGYIFVFPRCLREPRWAVQLFAVPVFLVLLNFFLAQSRAGILSLSAVLLGLALWMLKWQRVQKEPPVSRKLILVFGGLLLGAYLLARVMIGAATPPAEIQKLEDIRQLNIYSRFNLWTTALLITVDHPLLGVGPDNFRVYLPLYQVQARDLMRFEYEDMNYTRWAHNELLQLLAEGGLLGFIAVLWFLVRAGRQVLERLRPGSIPFEEIFPSLALLPFLVQSMLSWPLRFPPFAALFFVLLAFALGPVAVSSPWILSLQLRWLRASVAGGLLLLLGAGCWLFYWDWQVGDLKEHIGDLSKLESNLTRLEGLAANPFIAPDVLRGLYPFIHYAVRNQDAKLARRLIPPMQQGISLDGAAWQWYNLARLLLVAGDEAGAMTAVSKTLELDPIYEPAWGFRHYLEVLNVSRKTGRPVSELLPPKLSPQEFLNARYLPPPPQ